jgi:hypothetical protein
MMQNPSAPQPRFQMPGIEELPYQEAAFTELRKNRIISNMAIIDDQYIIFSHTNDTIRVSNVTRMVEAQKKMALIFLILLIVFSL